MSAQFDVSALRKHFPALQHKQIYFDNAGGKLGRLFVLLHLTRLIVSRKKEAKCFKKSSHRKDCMHSLSSGVAN